MGLWMRKLMHSLNFYGSNEWWSLVDEQEIEIEEGGESPGD